MRSKKIKPPFIWLAALLVLAAFVSVRAQTALPNQNGQQTPPNNAAAQAPQVQNLPDQLGFTPQQQQQWRQINREFRVQEIDTAAKVREARLTLNAAMESPNPNEEVIKQRAKELADAQSAVTQLRALRQARVLQMLTPEQRVKLKEIREHAAQANRQRPKGANALAPRQEMRRNANAPLLTPEQRKALRQQQKKQKP
jgi:Spy/CpxP family protein refolding chaperone